MGNSINQSAYNITHSKAWVQDVLSQNVHKRKSWILESIHTIIVKFRAKNEALKGEKREKFVNEMADEYLRHQSLSTKERRQLMFGVDSMTKGQRDTADIGEFMKYVRIGLTENKVKDRVALEHDIGQLIKKRAKLKEEWAEDHLPQQEGAKEVHLDKEMDKVLNETLSDGVRYVAPGARIGEKSDSPVTSSTPLTRMHINPLYGQALDTEISTDLVSLGKRAGLYEGKMDANELIKLYN